MWRTIRVTSEQFWHTFQHLQWKLLPIKSSTTTFFSFFLLSSCYPADNKQHPSAFTMPSCTSGYGDILWRNWIHPHCRLIRSHLVEPVYVIHVYFWMNLARPIPPYPHKHQFHHRKTRPEAALCRPSPVLWTWPLKQTKCRSNGLLCPTKWLNHLSVRWTTAPDQRGESDERRSLTRIIGSFARCIICVVFQNLSHSWCQHMVTWRENPFSFHYGL